MPVEGVDGYPLYWPEGWKRTESWKRSTARYDVNFARARDELLRSLKLMGVRENDIVISTNVPLRKDGLPYAGMAEPKDPAVAVYWTERRGWNSQRGDYDRIPRVMACDCWRTVRDNLRAIGLSLEALRAVKRAGATNILDRVFQGFTALPADTRPRSWREVLGVDLKHPTRAAIDAAFRALAVTAHPDAGGTHDRMVELNRAREEAFREIGA